MTRTHLTGTQFLRTQYAHHEKDYWDMNVPQYLKTTDKI